MILRMGAIIQGCFHIDPDTLDEEQFCRLWGRAKYFSEVAFNIDWKS